MEDDPFAEMCCPADWFGPQRCVESSDSDSQVTDMDLDETLNMGPPQPARQELPPCREWSTARLPNNHQPTEKEVSDTQWFQDIVAREEADSAAASSSEPKAREAEARPSRLSREERLSRLEKKSPWLSAAQIKDRYPSENVMATLAASLSPDLPKTQIQQPATQEPKAQIQQPATQEPPNLVEEGFDEDLECDSDNEYALVHGNVAPDFKLVGTYLEQWEQVAEHVKHAKRRRLHGKQSGDWSDGNDGNDGDDEAFIPVAPASRLSARAAHRLGISAKEYRGLRRAEAPCILYQILFYITSLLPSVRNPDVQLVDFYMGRGHIKEEAERRGFRALGYEVLDDAVLQNACTLQGLITMVLYCMRLGRNGVSHWGTVCSSWIFLSRNSTGRKKSDIRGYISCLAVRQGNTQVARMALALLLLQVRGAGWVLEQPSSSIMYLHDAMQWLWHRQRWHTAVTSMGAFGGPTQKPTKLRSNKAWIGKMRKKPSVNDQVRFKELKVTTARQLEPHADGRKRVSGEAQGLKDSQIYPIGYAQHLLTTYVEASVEVDSDGSSVSDYPEVPDMTEQANAFPWKDLDIHGLEAMMNQTPNRMPF